MKITKLPATYYSSLVREPHDYLCCSYGALSQEAGRMLKLHSQTRGPYAHARMETPVLTTLTLRKSCADI